MPPSADFSKLADGPELQAKTTNSMDAAMTGASRRVCRDLRRKALFMNVKSACFAKESGHSI
jgi:hypothetical protein